jgi:5-methylcytosine-specific restriction endonuclease McrA
MSNSQYIQSKFGTPGGKRRGTVLKCETCGREFYVPPCRERLGVVRYCSLKCRDFSGKKNPMYGKKLSKESIRKSVSHPNRKFFKPGKDNPNFVRFGDDFIGTTKNWWQKNKIKKGGKCERCGFSNMGILIVHHKDRNKRNNRPNNIEILCPNCHALEHFTAKDGSWHSH